ncbi:MAG: glycerol-3-phosphate dehydrogenase [Crocinitomicaceae bacterium]|nr:glycerol-3-phosphate dehydrogenase [Crocinitomicaceae bacterium]
MENNKNIGVIGGGSWATAIVKILQENNCVFWWMRSIDQAQHIEQYKHNPKYLSSAVIDSSKVSIINDLTTLINRSDILIVAVPSEFIHDTFLNIDKKIISKKIIVSAVKGIVPQLNLLPALYFNNQFNLSNNSIAIVSGPCHAEEVAMEKLSYLTFACENITVAKLLANQFNTKYIRSYVSEDMLGIELSAVLKNVYAISAGICHGLGYGDNFIAVLISNCIKELEVFLTQLYPTNRKINSTAYLGDLLVTSYSLHSRNRRFGNLIGRGYSVKAAKNEMNMIAEGYHASKCIYDLNKSYKVNAPIVNAVYQILHNSNKPKKVIKDLSELMS